jgi:beta-lactam-binding protein with PASTA domain
MLALLIPGVGMGGGGIAAVVFTVPDVVGETSSQALTDIENAGLEGSSSTDYSNTVAVGLVISQSPAAGSIVAVASTVTYVVSLGVRPQGPPKLYRRYRGYDAVVQRGDRKPRR